MRRPTQAQLVGTLQGCGYAFRAFQSVVEDPCRADDVEWNYKDIVHPHFVHAHMTRCYSFADAEGYSCIDVQRLFGFPIAQSVSTWVSGPKRLTTQTASALLIILIEVVFEDVGELRARTTTTYQIGSPSRVLLAAAFPVLRWTLKRNWDKFYRDDLRLRVRRGELRQQGFDFTPPLGIASTLKISDNHVVPPAGAGAPEVTRLDLAHREVRVVQVGPSDHHGLQVVLQPDRLEIYPRLCPHEGACLDTVHAPLNAHIQCPWHGRKFAPIVSLRYAEAPISVCGPLHRFTLTESELRIEPLSAADATAAADWASSPAPLLTLP